MFPSLLSLLCLIPFDLSSRLQVRPSQRATVWRSSVSPAPSAPASCGWKRPAPTPTTPSASATTTITSMPYQASVRRVRCARQVRACTRTANTVTTRCVRSARTIPSLTGRAPSTPACPAPCVKRTPRRWWLSARRPATLSVTVSLLHAQVAVTPSLQVTQSGTKEKRYIRVLASGRFVSDQQTKRHDWTGKSFVGRFWCPQRRTVIIICWLNRNTHLKMSREAQETGQVTSWTYKRSFPFGLPQSAHGSNKCGLAFLNHAKITNIPKPCYKQTLFTWVVFVAVLAVPVASDSLVDFTPLRTVYLRILDT